MNVDNDRRFIGIAFIFRDLLRKKIEDRKNTKKKRSFIMSGLEYQIKGETSVIREESNTIIKDIGQAKEAMLDSFIS